ncbi:MAG: nucleoside hydrolase [Solirubrobacterales bacterium]
MQSTEKTPLILDVDTGIDDALALLFTAASEQAELLAVTTCAGNTDVDTVTRNTLAVLELAGREEVEVAPGRAAPLCQPLTTTPETHGPQGIGRAVLPDPRSKPSTRSAHSLIIDSARERPGEITLVALGPLTNIAVAVLAEPELPRLLKRLVIMGGVFNGSGNTTPVTEWNTTVDPEAAAIVFREFGQDGAPRPLSMGLSVTESAKLLPAHLDTLREKTGDLPITRFVEDSLGFYFDFHAEFDGFRGAFVHDPFVVGATLDDSLVTATPLRVEVELGGRMTRGQTVADWRESWGQEPNADVAIDGEGGKFLDLMIDRIAELAMEREKAAGPADPES